MSNNQIEIPSTEEQSMYDMLIKDKDGWRQYAIMDENAAHNSIQAAKAEGSRVVAIEPRSGAVWGCSNEADRFGPEGI